MANTLLSDIAAVPLGYSICKFRGKKYGVTKSVHNLGKSVKIYAEELGGEDFISLNFYQTDRSDILKPCEMPEEKVLQFLRELEISEESV